MKLEDLAIVLTDKLLMDGVVEIDYIRSGEPNTFRVDINVRDELKLARILGLEDQP